MVYEIWDLESGNAVGDFDTEESALDEVRALIRVHGVPPLLPWALERHEGTVIVPLAEGERLISLALGIGQRATGQPSPPKRGGFPLGPTSPDPASEEIAAARQRAFGDVVRARRLELSLTIEQLAERAGVAVWGIEEIEAGRRGTVPMREPGHDAFSSLARGLGWDFDTFVNRIDARAEELLPGAGRDTPNKK